MTSNTTAHKWEELVPGLDNLAVNKQVVSRKGSRSLQVRR